MVQRTNVIHYLDCCSKETVTSCCQQSGQHSSSYKQLQQYLTVTQSRGDSDIQHKVTEQLVGLLQTFTKAWKAPGRLERGTDFTSALHLAVKCCGHLLVQTSVLLPKLNTAGHTAAPGTKASPFIPMLVPRNSPRTRAVSGSILQRPRKGYPGYVQCSYLHVDTDVPQSQAEIPAGVWRKCKTVPPGLENIKFTKSAERRAGPSLMRASHHLEKHWSSESSQLSFPSGWKHEFSFINTSQLPC